MLTNGSGSGEAVSVAPEDMEDSSPREVQAPLTRAYKGVWGAKTPSASPECATTLTCSPRRSFRTPLATGWPSPGETPRPSDPPRWYLNKRGSARTLAELSD